jgi:hypothetical protein
MNSNLVLEIAQLALSLLESQVNGPALQHAAVTGSLLTIIQKGAQAYQLHTGQPVDPALILAEAPV